MVQHWQEIQPIDRYLVASNGLLNDYDRKILTFLYQPLIGPISFTLYMTLWAQVEENRLWSETNSHHHLMSFTGLSLKAIHEARLKLEGIGLLKTLVKKEEGVRSFVYELQPPLPPNQFFMDGMLNVYLFQKIGKNQFLKLKRFFSDQSVEALEAYNNVTRSFTDVFESDVPSIVHHSSAMNEDLLEQEGQAFVGRLTPREIQVELSSFDFDLFLAGLSESLVPRKAITKKVREAISNLAYLYGIDPIQMKNLVMTAMDDVQNEVNIEELRKAARDWYQLENHDSLPSLIDKIQPPLHQADMDVPKTREEKLIRYLETTSPRQLLIDISGGAEASKGDLQIIEDVMFKQKLLPGVANVLIQYVLLKTDMKLTKSYVDKIASHWARKKVTTVQEAMELAKKEHRQYIEWAENKKKTKTVGKKQPIRTEALPEWFNEQNDQENSDKTTKPQNRQYEEKKREIEEKLKKYKK